MSSQLLGRVDGKIEDQACQGRKARPGSKITKAKRAVVQMTEHLPKKPQCHHKNKTSKLG
jgi:hypothetical protein